MHTIDRSLPLFPEYEPSLIWLVRDATAIELFYRRWQVRFRFGLSFEEAVEVALGVFGRWPLGKVRVEIE